MNTYSNIKERNIFDTISNASLYLSVAKHVRTLKEARKYAKYLTQSTKDLKAALEKAPPGSTNYRLLEYERYFLGNRLLILICHSLDLFFMVPDPCEWWKRTRSHLYDRRKHYTALEKLYLKEAPGGAIWTGPRTADGVAHTEEAGRILDEQTAELVGYLRDCVRRAE